MRADRAMAEGAAANKRIDLAAPLRSVRRADAPPRYKADLKSGPIRHPGTVPFVWEQRPGQPKSVRTRRAPPPTPPRDSTSSSSLARPEDIGGSPYHDALGPEALRGVAPDASRWTGASPRKEEDEEDEAAPAPAAEAWEEAGHQDAVVAPAVAPRKQEGGNEEDEERFSDALDTLSRSESLTMNCSVSGLSGALDRAPGGADPGARGFMMDRFLPAAHAVAVGSPQYTFRKAGAAAGATGNSGREHARAAAVKASLRNGDDRMRRAPEQLPHQHLPPNYLSCSYPRRLEHDEEEEDDDDDDYDVQSTRGFSAKGCGLLPGLCVKTSLMLLNPVPAMKRGKAQGRGRGHQFFTSKGPSPLARSSQNKPMGCDSNGQSWEDVYKHKLEQKYLGQGEDLRSKLTSESNQLTFWSDSQTGDGSSPFHHSTAGGTSPYHSCSVMSPSSKPNGSFGMGDRDEKARRSNGSGSLGRDHDHNSLVGSSDHSSFKGSSSMSSGLDRTGHEDSMDHRGDIDPEIGHLDLVLDTKDDGKNLVHSALQEAPLHLEGNGFDKKEIIPLQSLLPLPTPRSPSESWLSRTLPSVANKPPVPSFLGIQVQSKKQAPWASMHHPKENDKKPSRTRQIRFADVVERPASLPEI